MSEAPHLNQQGGRNDSDQGQTSSALDQTGELLAKLRALVAPIVGPAIEGMKAEADVMPELCAHGWYISYGFPLPLFATLKSFIAAGDRGAVDAAMCQWVNEEADSIESRLKPRYPHRAAIITDAFQAHRERKYTLSVPVLVAQIDGIGCEMLGIPRRFFRGDGRDGLLQRKLGGFELFDGLYKHRLTGVQETLLKPLRQSLSIELDTDRRDEIRQNKLWCGPLNRHGVQHGLDVDYPTEANSLRCISFLGYLLDVDRILHEQIPDEFQELKTKWAQALKLYEERRSDQSPSAVNGD